MRELSLPQLEALARTTTSLVHGQLAPLDPEARRRAEPQLITELLVTVWRGVPGFPRTAGAPPTPTEAAALQVLTAVIEHDPPRIPRRFTGGP